MEVFNIVYSVFKLVVNLWVDKDVEMVFGVLLYVIGDGVKSIG